MKPIYLEAGDTGLRQMNANFLESPKGRRACELGMKAIFLERTARRPRRFPDKSGSSRLEQTAASDDESDLSGNLGRAERASVASRPRDEPPISLYTRPGNSLNGHCTAGNSRK